MQGVAIRSSFQQQPCALLGVARGDAKINLARDTAFGIIQRLARDAVVNDVNHTAHRIAAIQQSTRATQHFNALHADGVARHGVVKAQT